MIFLIWVVTLAPLPWPVTPVMGATITVNTLNDDFTGGNGQCSLREAIRVANDNSVGSFTECTVSGTLGNDVISLQGGQTYTLSLGGAVGDEDLAAEDDLDIVAGSTITIVGNGATITRSGTCNPNGSVAAGEFRIFHVLSGGNLTLQNVTVTNGCADGSFPDNSGGGIFNGNTVTLTNSTISGNKAYRSGGGILNASGGTVIITNSTISNNTALNSDGGGIDNDGTVILTNSTISGNSAGDDGGGIRNFGTVTLTNSTLSGNSAGDDGGGIYNLDTVTITNSTISGNSTGGASGDDGGGIWNNDTVDASFVTIANNSAGTLGLGGGIRNESGATFNIKNSIVGNNTAGGGGPNCSGGVTASGTNLDTDGSCAALDADFTQVASTGAGGLNLGPLQVNAPGTTATHALLAGSAAVDFAADCTFLNPPGGDAGTDQRGVPRPQRSLCDAGAYEVQNPKTLSISISGSGNGTVMSNPGWINCPGTCTETYEQNTIVQLTATPGSGSVFTGWSGNSDCSDGQVAMNTDKACTATFVQQGTIVIQKTAIGGDGTFGFTRTGGSFSITTSSGSGSQSFGLAPGTYTVTENTPPTGWAFQNLTCTDPDGGTTVNVNTRTATIDLDAGETVTCTFTNTRLGVSLLTLQQGTKCLTLDLLAGSYVFRTDLGTFSGAIQFTQTPSVIRFRSVRGARPALSGMINLGARAGSAMLAQGFHRWITLVDRNIDDNGPCPP